MTCTATQTYLNSCIIDPDIKILYDDNEPGMYDNDKIFELERIYNNHASPDLRLYKMLGIHLDQTFDIHTKYLYNKQDKSLYCINRAICFLSQNALKTLYFTLIHPTYPTVLHHKLLQQQQYIYHHKSSKQSHTCNIR